MGRTWRRTIFAASSRGSRPLFGLDRPPQQAELLASADDNSQIDKKGPAAKMPWVLTCLILRFLCLTFPTHVTILQDKDLVETIFT